jgi:hypothetical protein
MVTLQVPGQRLGAVGKAPVLDYVGSLVCDLFHYTSNRQKRYPVFLAQMCPQKIHARIDDWVYPLIKGYLSMIGTMPQSPKFTPFANAQANHMSTVLCCDAYLVMP